MSGLKGGVAGVFFALAGAVLLAPCGASGGAIQETGRIEVEELWSLDGHSRLEMLSDINDIVEVSSQEIWISSGWEGVYSVDLSDWTGSGDRWIAFANEGEGPGELTGPGEIVVTSQSGIAVHDAGQGQIEFFGDSGEPLRTVQLPLGIGWTKGFSVLPSGRILVSGGTGLVDGGFHVFSEIGEYLGSWEEAAPAKETYARYVGTGGALDAAPDGSVLYSQNAPHRIVRYRFPEEPGATVSVQTIAEIPDLLEAPGDDILVRGVEDGTPFIDIDHGYAKSVAVFAVGDSLVLNVLTRGTGKERIATWQLFAPTKNEHYELVAESRVANYALHSLCENGDVLASRVDDLGVDTAVRLRWTVR